MSCSFPGKHADLLNCESCSVSGLARQSGQASSSLGSWSQRHSRPWRNSSRRAGEDCVFTEVTTAYNQSFTYCGLHALLELLTYIYSNAINALEAEQDGSCQKDSGMYYSSFMFPFCVYVRCKENGSSTKLLTQGLWIILSNEVMLCWKETFLLTF